MRLFAFALAVVSLVAATNRCVAESTEADQKIAQAIVETLREHQQAGRLKGFDIDLNVENGRVVLTGNVTDESQHDLAIDAARYAPGVKMVVNDLKIKGTARQHPEQQASPAQGNSGLLSGLRKAWTQSGDQQQQAVEPVADALPPTGTTGQQQNTAQAFLANATGEQIDRLANPDPLKHDDKHIASGYSAFTAGAAQSQIATVEAVSGAPALSQTEPELQKPTEQFVATPAAQAQPAQTELTRWAPRQEIKPVAQQPEVAQAIASNTTTVAQPASAQIAPAQPQPQVQPQAQPQQPQVQAVQVIPVPVPYYAPQMQRPRGPVAYASSRLPGAQQRGHVRMAQAAMPQQVAPAPQFIQGTGGGITPARYDHPNMPGYAWPSYASHPNYAALQYPKQYSAHAWPYIGPFYPYPQVPLGWRKVTLSWDDGWWHLDFKDRGYGPYLTR